jgi:hypothetical protein
MYIQRIGILSQTQGVTPNPIWNNLTNYWAFSETSGTTVADLKGNSTGTLTNAGARSASGKRGYCFTNNGGYNCGYTGAYNYTYAQKYSVSFWFKDVTGYPVVPILCNFDSNTTGWIDIYLNGQTIFFALFYNNFTGRCFVTAANVIPDTTNWHHVLCTYNGDKNANNMKIYIDGGNNVAAVATNSLTYTGTLGTTTIYTNKRNVTSYNNNALVDEIALFNGTVLSQADAATLYNSGAGLFY